MKKSEQSLAQCVDFTRVTDEVAHASAERLLAQEPAKLQKLYSRTIHAFEAAPIALGNLWRYETMLSRALERTLHELQRLQAARGGADVSAPSVVDVNIDLTPYSIQGGDDRDNQKSSSVFQNKPNFECTCQKTKRTDVFIVSVRFDLLESSTGSHVLPSKQDCKTKPIRLFATAELIM